MVIRMRASALKQNIRRRSKIFSIDFEEAQKYRRAHGQYLRPSQWQDLTVHVYI